MNHSPRKAAYLALARIAKERSYADIIIDTELKRGGLTGPDRGLFTELVYGTLRRQGTLDHIISQFSSAPIPRLEHSVLQLLRLGLYQIFYLDRVPVSAAVNETVNLAKAIAPKATGFINAVLRSADRGRETISYPDPDAAPLAYIAAKFSHPEWIAKRWIDQLGFHEATALAELSSSPPPLSIRVNRLKIDRETLAARLHSEGITTTPCQYAPDGLTMTSHLPMLTLDLFSEGFFTVQDEASQLAALLLAPEPGNSVLDLCAAPGGKTTCLAEISGDKGQITACDRSLRKLSLVTETAERLGLGSISTRELDASKPLADLPEFDRILVDAPCSGLGVIRRNPEGKWWKEPSDPARLAETQLKIMENAADRLKSGGVMVYSTCTTSIEENEGVIDKFLKTHPDFVVEPVSTILPQTLPMQTELGFFRSWPHRHGMDGFFAARLKKVP